MWTGALQADQDSVTLRLHGCVVGSACGENEYGVPGDQETPMCASELTLTDVTEGASSPPDAATSSPESTSSPDRDAIGYGNPVL